MKTINDLLVIMARLRDPNGGCPWDLEQDFASIAPYTIEEAYEVLDAIEKNDMSQLKSELGDLLLQVVFHSQMAAEQNLFTFDDVVTGISDKMIKRHPHVFSDAAARTTEEQLAGWEDQKAEERTASGAKSVLDDVTNALPAMTRAVKLQKRAARTGFEWKTPHDILEKLDEEIAELKQEMNIPQPDIHRVEDELGDILFVLTNLARKLDLDPEAVLRKANQKFDRRFRALEQLLVKEGTMENSTLEQRVAAWQQVKAQEKSA